MTELTSTPAESQPNPSAEGASGSGSGEPGTQVPAGYVPQSELDRVESQRRSTQAELDRLRAAQARSKPDAAPVDTPKGFDPDAFRSQLLGQVYGATALMQSVPELRQKFPNADPSLFSADVLSEFGSVEALAAAVEADHNRVAGLIDSQKATIEAEVKARFVEAYGQEPPTGPATTPVSTGAKSVAELSKMSIAELDEYEKSNPGKAEALAKAAA